MDFYLEMALTAVVALLFSFVMAKILSVIVPEVGDHGGGNHSIIESNEKSEIHSGEEIVMEKLRFVQKMDACVLQSERNVETAEENVEYVDRFVAEAVGVSELEEAAIGSGDFDVQREDLAVHSPEVESVANISSETLKMDEFMVRGQEDREAESAASVSPENMKAEEMIVREQEERGVAVSSENVGVNDMVFRRQVERKFESSSPVSTENVTAEETVGRGQEEQNDRVEIVESGDVVMAEPEEIRFEKSEMKEGFQEKTEELKIEEEDDWEGIEKSELQKAFEGAAKSLGESGEVIEISSHAKAELYGLYKIATEGPCRDSPPMALMVSARAKWNAWQKHGNMSQDEAMERYLELVSKEVSGGMHSDSIAEKSPEMGTQMKNSCSYNPGHEGVEIEGEVNEGSEIDNKAKRECEI